MRIVINISKAKYDEIMSMDWKNGRLIFDEETIAIHDGTPLNDIQWGVIHRIEEVYAKRKPLEYIKKPLAWALYQVWKEVDKEYGGIT